MARIIVKTSGSTDFTIIEEFINEEAANEGKYPEKRKVKLYQSKVINRKFRHRKEDDRI